MQRFESARLWRAPCSTARILALVLSLALTACGSDEPAATAAPPSAGATATAAQTHVLSGQTAAIEQARAVGATLGAAAARRDAEAERQSR
ncbi:MAG: hypothetical protein KDK91_12465 [Gammaproteobacteria bacterium]|nr:hypothetical protein [Gammaproteobacteria bacterium]